MKNVDNFWEFLTRILVKKKGLIKIFDAIFSDKMEIIAETKLDVVVVWSNIKANNIWFALLRQQLHAFPLF